MLMEAMRLSLQEHEEQQRRERDAANREGQNLNTTEESTPGDDALPASPPATPGLEGDSGSQTPAADHQQTLAGYENRPLTPIASLRRRTPSPAPTGSSTHLPPSSSSQGWRRRSSSPRNFSTIAAAMNATNTATAILNASDVPSGSSSAAGPSGTPNPPSNLTAATLSENVSLASDTSLMGVPSGSDGKSARPAIAVHTDSSILSTETTGYNDPESPPDSTISREHHLVSGPDIFPESPESPQSIKEAGSGK